MRDLPGYVETVARRLGSTGADVAGPTIGYVAGGLAAGVSIAAALPGSGIPQNSEIRFVERWERPYLDQPWRLTEYAYDLLDHERDVRLALHLHHADWFVANFRVVVHEHCEKPIGVARCAHYAGRPVNGGLDALYRLLAVWMEDPPPDCSALHGLR